ncbi:MAG: hypothetical protein ACYC8S_03570 [Minisyncoccota bacterium]
MDKNNTPVGDNGDNKKDFDLEGIIIEPVRDPGSGSSDQGNGASLPKNDSSDNGGSAIAHDLLEAGGIEIIQNGRAIDLNDLDMM